MMVELDMDELLVLRDAVRMHRDTLLAELAHADARRAARCSETS